VKVDALLAGIGDQSLGYLSVGMAWPATGRLLPVAGQSGGAAGSREQ
jgi:hypothetical protein